LEGIFPTGLNFDIRIFPGNQEIRRPPGPGKIGGQRATINQFQVRESGAGAANQYDQQDSGFRTHVQD
jgi:hypothetical protein